MWRTAGVFLRDRIKYTDIMEGLGATQVMKKVKDYRKKWRTHFERIEEYRSLKFVMNYTSVSKRPGERSRRKLFKTSGFSKGSDSNTPISSECELLDRMWDGMIGFMNFCIEFWNFG